MAGGAPTVRDGFPAHAQPPRATSERRRPQATPSMSSSVHARRHPQTTPFVSDAPSGRPGPTESRNVRSPSPDPAQVRSARSHPDRPQERSAAPGSRPSVASRLRGRRRTPQVSDTSEGATRRKPHGGCPRGATPHDGGPFVHHTTVDRPPGGDPREGGPRGTAQERRFARDGRREVAQDRVGPIRRGHRGGPTTRRRA